VLIPVRQVGKQPLVHPGARWHSSQPGGDPLVLRQGDEEPMVLAGRPLRTQPRGLEAIGSGSHGRRGYVHSKA
jgi:hypothetical protein